MTRPGERCEAPSQAAYEQSCEQYFTEAKPYYLAYRAAVQAASEVFESRTSEAYRAREQTTQAVEGAHKRSWDYWSKAVKARQIGLSEPSVQAFEDASTQAYEEAKAIGKAFDEAERLSEPRSRIPDTGAILRWAEQRLGAPRTSPRVDPFEGKGRWTNRPANPLEATSEELLAEREKLRT